MPGSADTGARERLSALKTQLRTIAEGAAPALNQYEAADLLREIEELERLAPLAAGVGVPPEITDSEHLGSGLVQTADEIRARVEAVLADATVTYGVMDDDGEAVTPLMTETAAIRAALASGASAAEGRNPETPAGVGEARPAEPQIGWPKGESLEATHAWIREFCGDHAYAHELADDLNEQLAECGRLRGQLDAARQVLDFYATAEVSGHAWDGGALARAALGVVGPPPDEDLVAESAESADVRGGES